MEKIFKELQQEIDKTVPIILKIKSSKLLKREHRVPATSQISEKKSYSPKEENQTKNYFQKNNSFYCDVKMKIQRDYNITKVGRKEHSFILRLSATLENFDEEDSLFLNQNVEGASAQNKGNQMLMNICEEKLDLIVDNLSDVLGLCDACELASEQIANERNNRYSMSNSLY